MGKAKPCDCPKCLPAWLAAFGDLMSLLLCFFVLLLSMSSMDAKKISEAIGSLAGAMSVLEGGTKTEISKQRIQESTPVERQDESSESVNRIKQAIEDANEMRKKGQGSTITLEESQKGFVIELPAQMLFKPGSAEIDNSDMILFLKRIALIVQELPNSVELSVRGFTDDVAPGVSSPFKDNWELSGARALSVLRELMQDGVLPQRMHAAAFGKYRPKASNATAQGRAANRRVELFFYGDESSDKQSIQKSILDNKAAK